MSETTIIDNGFGWSSGGSSGGKFADPFFLESSGFIPDSIQTVMDLARFLYYLNPQYQMASRRVVSHFITDIDFKTGPGDKSEKDELRDYMFDQLGLRDILLEAGEEWATFGNGIYRLHFPFDRVLIDSRDGKFSHYSIDLFGEDAKFELPTMTYNVLDPRKPGSGQRVSLHFLDIPSRDMNRIKTVRLDPQRITIEHGFMGKTNRYIYRFEEFIIRDIKNGKLHQVNCTPIPMLQAILKNQDFRFNEDEIYHMRGPSVSGISNGGWGVPPTIANYRSIHQLQVYRKIDEAVGLDHVLPFRLFSPNLGANIGDAAVDSLMADWHTDMKEMIATRRKDLTAIHALPFPVSFQSVGGDGKLVPMDAIQFHTNDMLDGMGYPAELFRGSMQMQNMPTAIRMFETAFGFIYSGFNGLLRWLVRRILDHLNREQIKVSLTLPSMAANIEKQYLYMQLAASGEISRSLAYKGLGVVDPVQEIARRLDEDLAIEKHKAEKSEQFQKEMEAGPAMNQAAQGGGQGGSPPGGAGSPPGASGGSTTPLDIMSEAQQLAQTWLAIPENGERSKAMSQVQSTRPDLYAVAKDQMGKMRDQGASQGRAQVGQQASQPGDPSQTSPTPPPA